MKTLSPDYLETLPSIPVIAQPAPSADMADRIAQLGVGDQMLLQMALRDLLPIREIARVVGCDAGTVSRRLQALHKRLRDPLVMALCDKRCPLPDDYRQIGLDYFLRSRNAREISELRQVSRFHVTQLIHFMRSWFRGLCANTSFFPK